MPIYKEKFPRPSDACKMGLNLHYEEEYSLGTHAMGEVFIEMRDAETNDLIESWYYKNLITLDASILTAILLRDPSSRSYGINMLAVGTGATGALLSPDAPDNRQRKLNAEIERKGFSSTTFRNAVGTAVAYPTNIVDFTTTFAAAEAVGPLNEMGLLSTLSSNPAIKNPNPDTFPTRDTTRDLSTYDVMANYLTFSVISKPSTAVLVITWRLTF